MPKPIMESNSAHLYPRERAPPVTLDWIDGKNVKLLRVANHRETFRLQKLSQALSTIENIHKACWLREERRVRQGLRRLASVSPPCSSRTLFKRDSGSMHGASGGCSKGSMHGASGGCSKGSMQGGSGLELPPCGLVQGGGRGGGGGGEVVPSTPVPSQQSAATPSPRAAAKGLLPNLTRSTAPSSLSTPFSTTPSSLWAPTYVGGGRGGGGAGRSSGSSSFSSSLALGAGSVEGASPGPLVLTPSLLALLPPHLSPELHGLQEAVLGFPLLQKRVRQMMAHARAVEQQRQERRSFALKPQEALQCRYLRLSENNISTLVQLCKKSGMDVDIHPHMKDSDIDISTLFKNSPSPSASTELV